MTEMLRHQDSSACGEAEGPVSPFCAVILAAGRSKRLQSSTPKVLHKVAGQSLLSHVLTSVVALKPQKIVGVVPSSAIEIADAFAPYPTVVQDPPRGTGDAVRIARPSLPSSSDILVLFGDTPLVRPETLRRLLAAMHNGRSPAIALLTFTPEDPAEYGRIVTNPTGEIERVVEAKDATPQELAIQRCNGGMMVLRGTLIDSLLPKLTSANAQGEYYLTDLVALARAAGHAVAAVEATQDETLGVNTRADLARVEGAMQKRLRAAALAAGVTLQDPDTTYLSADTDLAADVQVGGHVVFGPGVKVARGAVIHPFSHLEGTIIAENAVIGPFARLRPGTHIGTGAHIGNFVELKATQIGDGAKANHLTYLGDATVGAAANVGAGTITCNYDGYSKNRTEIGEGAFIGSNTALVAPVNVGAGAYVAAGSVITEDVPADALAIARARQETRPEWARRYRAKRPARA